MHLAAGQGNNAIVKLLLGHGANINCREDDGSTPLIVASARGRASTVKLLLKEQSDFNMKDRLGRTALTVAKEKDHLKVAYMQKKT